MNESWLQHWPEAARPVDDNPFTSDAFLSALESSGACADQSGWQPEHLKLSEDICVPVYRKHHSWGEYVFDWAWAQAYEQYGLRYYPKLVLAVPYTPSTGPRLLGARQQQDAHDIVRAFKSHCRDTDASGFHILFPNATDREWLDNCDLVRRQDVQFHWRNQNYRDFDDFLDRFASRKRKNVRKERLSIAAQGIELETLTGHDITTEAWHAFYRFYHATYLKRGRHGYLNRAFFDQIRQTMPDSLVLIMARKDGAYIAGALCFRDSHSLYGRYWGSIDDYYNLHFETCYYQGIDYCIRQGLQRFDPGTQGEHKIARGFEPTLTFSYHWLSNPQFFEAAWNFCENERKMIQDYLQQTQDALPFKQSL